MKKSSKTALGGMVAALSVSLLFLVSVVPFLTYALPAAAAALLILVVIEINKKWAFGVYVSVSLLGLLVVPNKEVAVLYAAFFGFYPIVKAAIEKNMPRVVEYTLKVLLFLVMMVSAYFLMIRFMGITIEETESFGRFALPVLLGTGCVAFLVYDYALTKLIGLYVFKWQKRFRKYFK